MDDGLIEKVNSPQDLKRLSVKELALYSQSVREFITDTVMRNGGHLSSNLGAVDLTVALHYVFNSPDDKIVWDVGHQSYTHKLITGRAELLKDLRKNDGAGGFPSVNESEHDQFTVGHSSTSLSSAAALCRVRDLEGGKYNVVAVIGDGALTGGMAYEALNDIGSRNSRLIIILNDNRMSISQNVGAMAKYLSKLRMSKGYSGIKSGIKKGFGALPFFGGKIVKLFQRFKNILKNAFIADKMFEQMGIKYYGPFDGHNLKTMIGVFQSIKDDSLPVLIHLRTHKGKGDENAERQPDRFHGVMPSGATPSKSYSLVAGETLCALAEQDPKIIAITAAMSDGTGLKEFSLSYPDRFFDTAIAEQHAVTLASGLAKGGFKPYFAVYSSFLQRGFDQILHDTGIMNLPVTFLVDRAGVIGSDGVTHQGVFDISYLSLMPSMTLMTPSCGRELRNMIEFSLGFNAPLAIRYPKSFENDYDCKVIGYGKWDVLKNGNKTVYILCAGSRMLDIAFQTEGAYIVNARFIKPLDEDYLKQVNFEGSLIITCEDAIKRGGFGESVLSFLNMQGLKAEVKILALENEYIFNLDIDEVFRQNGLSKDSIQNLIDKKCVITLE